MTADPLKKRYMIVHRHPPHASIDAWEAISLSLALAAFEQQTTVVYLGDAVYQLLAYQDTTQLGIKNYSRAVKAYPDYHIKHIYALQCDLEERHMLNADLLLAVTPLQAAELRNIMQQQDVIIHF